MLWGIILKTSANVHDPLLDGSSVELTLYIDSIMGGCFGQGYLWTSLALISPSVIISWKLKQAFVLSLSLEGGETVS